MPDCPEYGHALTGDDPALPGTGMPAAGPQTRFVLERDERNRLQLRDRRQPRWQPLRVDGDDPESRRRAQAGRRQPLARACGLHRRTDLHILDATAGLGRDAFCLAQLGARLTLYERHPALQALLRDAIDRLPADIAGRMQLVPASSLDIPWPAADVVFLDPMFPSPGKRAAPGREMQYLQQLLGADTDAEALWQYAMRSGIRRVVLKRPPRGARVRLGTPDASFGGGRVVYDVYFPTAA